MFVVLDMVYYVLLFTFHMPICHSLHSLIIAMLSPIKLLPYVVSCDGRGRNCSVVLRCVAVALRPWRCSSLVGEDECRQGRNATVI